MFCFSHFNLVGVAIDAMHSLYSGVTKAIISLWFDSCNLLVRGILSLII